MSFALKIYVKEVTYSILSFQKEHFRNKFYFSFSKTGLRFYDVYFTRKEYFEDMICYIHKIFRQLVNLAMQIFCTKSYLYFFNFTIIKHHYYLHLLLVFVLSILCISRNLVCKTNKVYERFNCCTLVSLVNTINKIGTRVDI